MSQFLLLLYNDTTRPPNLSPDEMQKMLERYMAWREKPFTLDGKRLAEDVGRVIRSNSGKPRTSDGPYSETKEVLAGFYLIEAANYDEAVKLALTNPHAERGAIEVRQIYGS
ncbi:MAG TPA: YciI family protein [Candidatus Acidoferrales bacterium]|nr:YciI family protein [Candidatus Acidoferrales bacterium]